MGTAADVMTTNVVTAKEETTLESALKMMEEKKISHLVVVDKDHKLKGILSDRDVKKFVSPFAGSSRETEQDRATLNIKAGKFMKTQVTTVKPGDTVKLCVERMLQKSIHALPVTDDDGTVKGIVTTTDLLKVLITLL